MEFSGFTLIDEQHGHLLESVQQLKDWVRLGRGETAVFTMTTALAEYVVQHFAYEEELLHTLPNFPNLAKHLEQHKHLTLFAGDTLDLLLKGEVVVEDLLQNLEDWLIDHIDEEALHFRTYDPATLTYK